MSTEPITPDFGASETPATSSTPSSESTALSWDTAPEVSATKELVWEQLFSWAEKGGKLDG